MKLNDYMDHIIIDYKSKFNIISLDCIYIRHINNNELFKIIMKYVDNHKRCRVSIMRNRVRLGSRDYGYRDMSLTLMRAVFRQHIRPSRSGFVYYENS